jgi:hypothetical protein
MDTSEGWERHFEFVTQSGRDTGNDELQDFVPEQVRHTAGSGLSLVLERRNGRYVSGKIRSRRSLHEMAPNGGVLEIKLQGPQCRGGVRGIWPAIWLLPSAGPWPTKGEVDLFEVMVFEPEGVRRAFSTLHFGPRANVDAVWPGHWGLSLGAYPWDEAQHTLRLDWRREGSSWTLRFAVDGQELWHFTTTRNDIFRDFERGKALPDGFGPGAPGDPAAIFARGLEADDGLHVICNLSMGGRPFRHVDAIEHAELTLQGVRLTPY